MKLKLLLLTFIIVSLSFIIVSLSFIFSSCEKEDCTTVMTFERFFLEDKEGNDLLNIADYDFIEDIEIFYSVDGKVEKGNFSIGLYDEDRYCLTINLNGEVAHDNTSYTYVRWNQYDTDTIIANVDTGSKGGCERDVRTMIAYNDSVWKRPPSSGSTDYYVFKVVK